MNKKTLIFGVISTVLLFTLIFVINNKITYEKAKKDMLNEYQTREDLILVEKIKEQKVKVDNLDKLIKLHTAELEETKTIKACTETQLKRLLDGVEYGINYCTGSNLEQFKNFQ